MKARKIPVVKRLYPAVMKKWAALTWPQGYKVKKYNGIKFLLNWKNFVDREVGLFGGYEVEQASFLLSQIRENGCDTFFDIGANFGLYSLQVAKDGYAARIHAFEPDPRNFAQMDGNLRLNCMLDAIKMHQIALSDCDGHLEFDLAAETSTGQTMVMSGGGTKLPVTMLDRLFGDLKNKVLFFKIDIEGHEVSALKGAENILRMNDCFLQIESFAENIASVSAFLEGLGYEKIHQIESDHYFKKTGMAERIRSRRNSPIDKNIIMCMTTGRSGTNLLQELLALTEDTCALHEPEPAFQSVLRDVQNSPDAAAAFVREHKLPYIIFRAEKNYVETSHLFGKGFFEAFTSLNIPFRMIVLNREPREVAKSLWRIKTIPRRTKSGRQFLLDPGQKDVMAPKGWRFMTDYQLCYWYCLEVERRKTLYLKECHRRGIPVIEISLEQLKDWESFSKLCTVCDLRLPETARKAYDEIIGKKVNAKSKHHERQLRISFDKQEQKVWHALGQQRNNSLMAEIKERYAVK